MQGSTWLTGIMNEERRPKRGPYYLVKGVPAKSKSSTFISGVLVRLSLVVPPPLPPFLARPLLGGWLLPPGGRRLSLGLRRFPRGGDSPGEDGDVVGSAGT